MKLLQGGIIGTAFIKHVEAYEGEKDFGIVTFIKKILHN
jgi:hypothetical protein